MFGKNHKLQGQIHRLRQEMYQLRNDTKAQLHDIKKQLKELQAQAQSTSINLDYKHKQIEKLQETLGSEDSSLITYITYYGSPPEPPKAFTVKEQIKAILDHLGLVESATQENKLIPAPKQLTKKKKVSN